MKLSAAPILLLILLLNIFSSSLYAQEESKEVNAQGSKYISLKINSLEKLNKRLQRQQDRIINKLKRKEKHLVNKLKSSDSLAYARYRQQRTASFDSIKTLSKSDTGSTAANFSKGKNGSVDSLKKIAAFVQKNSGLGTPMPGADPQNAEMNQLKGQLNFKAYITQLISQRMNSLKNISGSSDIPGLTGMEKQVFYGKAKMKVFQDMEEDPTIAEDKAMEYLQGTEGFDNAMKDAGGNGGMGSMTSADQMEQMGYQTKALMQKSLQQKFGANNLGMITKQMSSQLTDWQNKEKDLTGNISDTKNSISGIRNTGKPSFKVNPMRELPFWKRIQKQYSWQATRASTDGTQPAMVTPSVMLGYKQSPKLVYGVGLATAFGLGQSWSDISFSFKGIGYRTFATWTWQYGIGIYAGYERMYDGFTFTQNQQQTTSTDANTSTHSNGNYIESLLVGLTKTYKINKKYTGQMQLLYDVWWQEKGLQSPFVLRLATITN